MKILLTGATGVIGRAAMPYLVAAGHDVTAVYRSDDDRSWLEEAGARPLAASLFDPEAVRRATAGIDTVAHFATSIPKQSDMKTRSCWAMNDRLRTKATSHLVDAALEQGAGRFVQESISFFYADGGDSWLDESSPIAPAWDVLDSALDAEGHVERFRRGGGTGVVLRMARLYGPGRTSGDYIEGVRNRAIPIVGRGDNYVSSLHIDDARTALVAALTAPDGVYNVGDDHPMTWADNLVALSRTLGAPEPRRIPALLARVVVGNVSNLLTLSHRISNQAFREATGWSPSHPDAGAGWEASVVQNQS